jgi:hypothetical protein
MKEQGKYVVTMQSIGHVRWSRGASFYVDCVWRFAGQRALELLFILKILIVKIQVKAALRKHFG